MPNLIDIRNLDHPNRPAVNRVRFQMGTTRPVETDEARLNWSSVGSPQLGYSKHHQVPWNALKSIMNRAMLDLADRSNSVLWDAIVKASYPGGNAGDNRVPLANAVSFIKEYRFPNIPIPGVGPIWQEQDAAGTLLAHANAINALASRFCWMPGNFFLGPTPGSRLDDPGDDGYDQPPMGKGGKLAAELKLLYDATRTPDWNAVVQKLDALFDQKVSNKGSAINFDINDWQVKLIPGTATNTFKKRLA